MSMGIVLAMRDYLMRIKAILILIHLLMELVYLGLHGIILVTSHRGEVGIKITNHSIIHWVLLINDQL